MKECSEVGAGKLEVDVDNTGGRVARVGNKAGSNIREQGKPTWSSSLEMPGRGEV
jgi:hypothetical protein